MQIRIAWTSSCSSLNSKYADRIKRCWAHLLQKTWKGKKNFNRLNIHFIIRYKSEFPQRLDYPWRISALRFSIDMKHISWSVHRYSTLNVPNLVEKMGRKWFAMFLENYKLYLGHCRNGTNHLHNLSTGALWLGSSHIKNIKRRNNNAFSFCFNNAVFATHAFYLEISRHVVDCCLRWIKVGETEELVHRSCGEFLFLSFSESLKWVSTNIGNSLFASSCPSKRLV